MISQEVDNAIVVTIALVYAVRLMTSDFGGGFSSGVDSGMFDSPLSPSPSTILEQEAQIFGFRERLFPSADIGSPQQTQTRNLMAGQSIHQTCSHFKWNQEVDHAAVCWRRRNSSRAAFNSERGRFPSSRLALLWPCRRS